ncbi:MAG: ATP-binding protein [Deltaproteobacteria bacterium]|nr:ATP-binding protein [Deltaproteobacteria bacterium]
MRQIAIISGKGGTGKTSIVASLFALAGRAVAVDCDVDAADLALVVPGDDVLREPFVAGRKAVLDCESCAACAECVSACRSGALELDTDTETIRVDPLRCEGCGVCGLVCPMGCVSYRDNVAGEWMVRRTSSGILVHAALGIAQDNSGKLVAHIREEARRLAKAEGHDLILIDGPPGIGCPVHAAITGADLLLVVTEPTLSGEHDLIRVMDLADHFMLDVNVLINKHDLAPRLTSRIEALCARRGVDVVGRLPFDPAVPVALSRGELPLVVESVAPHLHALGIALLGRQHVSPGVLPRREARPVDRGAVDD